MYVSPAMVRSVSIGFTTYCNKNERLEKGLQEYRVTFYKISS